MAEASQVLFFNPTEGYRVSHPIPGGDASIDLKVDEALLRELAPKALLQTRAALAFRNQRLPIDPRTQALVAMLRHGLHRGIAEPLEGETLALTLVRRALAPEKAIRRSAAAGRQRLADRVKLVLASDLSRRWTLAEVAAEVGGSAVYLTQVFQQVEGLPLYRYHLNLRLTRALDLIGKCDDLSALSHDLGFSSHSHFSAAFKRTFGRTPSQFRESALRR